MSFHPGIRQERVEAQRGQKAHKGERRHPRSEGPNQKDGLLHAIAPPDEGPGKSDQRDADS